MWHSLSLYLSLSVCACAFFSFARHQLRLVACATSISELCVLSTRDGYRLVFLRYRYITDIFKTIPVPKRCQNRYFFFFKRKATIDNIKERLFLLPRQFFFFKLNNILTV